MKGDQTGHCLLWKPFEKSGRQVYFRHDKIDVMGFPTEIS